MSKLREDELMVLKRDYLRNILDTPGSDLDFYARILESNEEDDIKEIYDEFIETIQKEQG